MATAKLILKTIDQNDNAIRTTWSKITPSITTQAQFTALDGALRKVVTNLSNDTYNDAEYIVTHLISEEIED